MGYGRHADPYDFFKVRLVVMNVEALREETQRLWAEKRCNGIGNLGVMMG
ncbi:MAG: hypothetical protein KDJ54_09345 [Candidatus Competibacteraceae bacterium]|nr:hypothetical protein [Candidatus Competibacteraceae bacterium]